MIPNQEPLDSATQRIRDPRIRFYLDNFTVIEAWAQLRIEANEALHELLLDLVDTLTQQALDRGDADIEVRADEITNSRKPRVTMTRRSWQDPSGHSPAAIVVEWHSPPIDKNGELFLYVGVRVGDRRRRDLRVAKYLSGLAPALRGQLGSPWEREADSFPVWRWITPQGESLDEAALLDDARRAAWACWDVSAKHIDGVLSNLDA